MPETDRPQEPENQPQAEESLVPVSFSTLRVARRRQREAELVITEPAHASGTAFALADLTQVSLDNRTGTPRPHHLVVAVDSKNERLYFMPVGRDHPEETLSVSYGHSGFMISLYPLFRSMDRLVAKRYREVYKLHTTKSPITIGETSGKALYIQLNKVKRERVGTMPAERKAGMLAKRARKPNGARTGSGD